MRQIIENVPRRAKADEEGGETMQACSNNPSAVRSREAIVRSLLELMGKRPFEDITMQMIADAAGLARRTLYRHFSSKTGILAYYADLLKEEYIQLLSEAGRGREITARIYFSFWLSHLDFLRLIHRNGLMTMVLTCMEDALGSIASTVRVADMRDSDGAYVPYYQAYHAGSYWRMLCQWLEGGARESPEEMAAIYRRIALGTYKHLRTNPPWNEAKE